MAALLFEKPPTVRRRRRWWAVGLVTMVVLLFLSYQAGRSVFEALTFADLLQPDGKAQLKTFFFTADFALVGALVFMVMFALVFCLPMAVLVALFATIEAMRHHFFLKSTVNVLSAIPPIFYGFAFQLFLTTALRIGEIAPLPNAVCYGFTLGVMVLPTLINRSMEAFLKIPIRFYESAAALGASQPQIALWVYLPKSTKPILAGVLVAFARTFAETVLVALALGLVESILNSLLSILIFTGGLSFVAILLNSDYHDPDLREDDREMP